MQGIQVLFFASMPAVHLLIVSFFVKQAIARVYTLETVNEFCRRTAIGRQYGISVTSTAFTSPISQKLAERCGFETLAEKSYGDMLDEAGKPFFPGLETKTLKIMAKKLY